ncbi:MAG TPA: chloride channel protein [Candidatus Kapabacteria bacterium]|nr:chloride channel protein [Candidatus Kapabacteria bacterium]
MKIKAQLPYSLDQYRNLGKEVYQSISQTEYVFVFALAIIVGLLTGFAEVILKLIIEFFTDLFFSNNITSGNKFKDYTWVFLVILPSIGFIITQLLMQVLSIKAKMHGVSQVIYSILLKHGLIKPIAPITEGITSAITIGTGGSVGPEGPAIYLGAGIGSIISKIFNVNPRRMQILAAAGAGAGIAAAFNAPIAGALFAIEIILMDFHFNQFSVVVIATVFATFVSRSLLGDVASFSSVQYQLHNGFEFLLFAVLGVFSGLVSFLFIKFLYWLEDFIKTKLRINKYLKALLGGILLGAIGLILPEVLGVGYDVIDNFLKNKIIWYIALFLIFAKIFTTSLTLSSGGMGGIFAPTLVIGASLGSFFGYIFNYISPELAPQPEAYVILGMAGLLSGTIHAPITSIIMIFELTKNQNFILPAMITCVISIAISRRLIRESIYMQPLAKNNLLLPQLTELNILNSIPVKEVFTGNYLIISEKENLKLIISKLLKQNISVLVVEDNFEKFIGLITMDQVREILFDQDVLGELLIAGDIAKRNCPIIKESDTLKTAWDVMNQSKLDYLPVSDDEDTFKIVGIISRKDLDEIYNQEIKKFDMSMNLASSLTLSNAEEGIPIFGQYVLQEIEVSKSFLGKTIKELDIRNRFKVEIILIKSIDKRNNTQVIIPTGNYKFKKNDRIVISGNQNDINKFKIID